MSQDDAMREMECLVAAYARHSGVMLMRRALATPEQVMAVKCPHHGWAPCGDVDGVLHRGCLGRQIEALRSDYFPPQQAATAGALDDGSCIDNIATAEVHCGA